MSSCTSDKIKFEQALLRQSCDVVDTMLSQGYTPDRNSIRIVCRNGNLSLLQTLLKYDMNVQLGLFTAVQYKRIHVLDYLYIAGVDINLPDEDGCTALHKTTDPDTCKWLLDMGAQYLVDSNGRTPLVTALVASKYDVATLLIPYEQTSQTKGLLNIAIMCGDRATQLVLSHQVGIDSICGYDHQGDTPLHIACRRGNEKLVKLILSHKEGVQTINQYNYIGTTPMNEAKTYPDILALLQTYM